MAAASVVPDDDVPCAVAKEVVAFPHRVDVEQSSTWNDPHVDAVFADAVAVAGAAAAADDAAIDVHPHYG